MSAPIDTYLRFINEKEWASEVRTAIVNAIRECYNNTEDPELRTDALEAAIQAKIDAGQMAALTIGDGTITAAKLANEIITTAKIADGAITQAKLDPNIEFVRVDGTLSHAGEAADAKATGDAISELNGSLHNLNAIKSTLFDIANNVVFKDNNANIYIERMVKAFEGKIAMIGQSDFTSKTTISSITDINGDTIASGGAGYMFYSKDTFESETVVTVTVPFTGHNYRNSYICSYDHANGIGTNGVPIGKYNVIDTDTKDVTVKQGERVAVVFITGGTTGDITAKWEVG